jgi:hypothetical protein
VTPWLFRRAAWAKISILLHVVESFPTLFLLYYESEWKEDPKSFDIWERRPIVGETKSHINRWNKGITFFG